MLFRTPVITWTFFVVATILFGSATAVGQKKRNEFVWPKMRIQGTNHQLSSELKSLAPFDTDRYFSIKDRDNREQLYLRPILLLNTTFSKKDPPYAWFAEKIGAEQCALNAAIRNRSKKAARDHEKIETLKRRSKEWSPRRDRYILDENYKPRMVRLLKNFDWVYDEFESAQEERSQCYVHQTISKPFTPIKIDLMRLMDIAEAVVAVEPLDGFSYLRICNIHLTLSRDFSRCARQSYVPLEQFTLKTLFPLGISTTDDAAEVDACIDSLKTHLAETKSVDLLLEASKHQFLCTVSNLIVLRDKSYNRQWNQPNRWDEPTAITNLLYDSFQCVGLSSSSFADMLERRLDPKNAAIAQFTDKEKTELEGLQKQMRDFKDPHRCGIAEAIYVKIVNDMSRADFDQLIAIQQTRYRDIEKACNKNASARAEDIKILSDLWTMDPSWKALPILGITGCDHISDNEIDRRFYRRAALCIAVVKKWRMTHDNHPPSTLKEAFDFAAAGNVPRDPYDEKNSLSMSNSKVGCVISSVGPDPANAELEYYVEFEN